MRAAQMIATLETWLRRQPELGPEARICEHAVPKTGFSADTLLLDVATGPDDAAPRRRLVVRIEHPGRNTFLDASIGKQARMMRELGRQGIPAPAVIGWEEDASVIGASFLVMDWVDGVSLPMHPSYHRAGLLIELDPAVRRATWLEAIDTITSINRLDWRGRFDFLLFDRYGEPGLEGYLAWMSAWRDVACGGRPHSTVDAALDYLKENRPRNAAVELLWGDSNPGNFMFGRSGGVAAVLDFEASAIGPAEIDLAWWFFIDQMVAGGEPLPPGMPDRDEQIHAFEAAIGRPVEALDYYARLCGVRMSLVMAQTVRNLIDDGKLKADSRAWFANPAASMLATSMELPDPGPQDDYFRMVAVMNER